MKFLLPGIVCFLLPACHPVKKASFSPAQFDFPADYTGRWKGELHWFVAGKNEPKKIPMQLNILPSDTTGHYSWGLVYGADSSDRRPYVLQPADSTGVHWIINERNGILIDLYAVGGRFTNVFSVQSALILNTGHRAGDSLVLEFHSMGSGPSGTSGLGTDDVPTVRSYPVRGYQRAVLRRAN